MTINKQIKRDNRKDLDFEKELWKAADKLRGSIDVSEYKHIVLGLIFLKYVSDSFNKRRAELIKWAEKNLKDKKARENFIESKDEYKSQGIFFVPEKARWSYLQSKASQPSYASSLASN